jgi:hypothetical protein
MYQPANNLSFASKKQPKTNWKKIALTFAGVGERLNLTTHFV